MNKIDETTTYFRILQMFHELNNIPIQQLNSKDKIRGKKLGYSILAHRGLSESINNKYFEDVNVQTDPYEVGDQKTIGDLSDHVWSKVPTKNKIKSK